MTRFARGWHANRLRMSQRGAAPQQAIAELLGGASSGRDRIGVSLGGEVAVLDP